MIHNDVELEKAVLGAILIEPHVLPTVLPILKDGFFYDAANQTIFRSIRQMYEKREEIDILTVVQSLGKDGRIEMVGGAFYVSKLTNRVANAGSIEKHTLKLYEMYLLREIGKVSASLHARSQDAGADCFELIEDALKQFNDMNTITTSKIKTVAEVYVELHDDIVKVQETGLPPGMLTGLGKLDRHTGGWQRGTLNVIAARPGMGKTAFALRCAKYPAMELKKPVLIFSLEMTAKALVGRLAASESTANSGMESSKINQKDLTRKELQDLGARCFKLLGAPIYIDDTPAMKFSTMRAKVLKMHHEHKIELVIIDYMQLMHGDEKGNREQEISYISRNLKALSKEIDVPIIALSQLSRKVEDRPEKRPQLSDLRESGAIEQDADMVCFLFRPEYYNLFPNGYPYKTDTIQAENLMLFDIAKGREVKPGEIPLKFYGNYMIVDNYFDEESQPLQPFQPLQDNHGFLTSNSEL